MCILTIQHTNTQPETGKILFFVKTMKKLLRDSIIIIFRCSDEEKKETDRF